MPDKDNKILKCNPGKNSMKVSFIIYANSSVYFKKMHSCQNVPKKYNTEKKYSHMPSGYSLFQCSFDATKNKTDYYRGKDCMNRFCKELKNRTIEIINYEKKEMIPLTDEENKYYEKQKDCYMWKKELNTDKNDKNAFKLYRKVRDHCHYAGKYTRAAHDICNLRYKTPKGIPVVFHNGSTYNYHFIIEELANEFEDKLNA